MELVARNFEIYPKESAAAQHLLPLLTQLHEVRFPISVGLRNSKQLTYAFDIHLEAQLIANGAEKTAFKMPSGINHQYDFAFRFHDKTVVIEVEKANWEKILRDLLKFHSYFQHGADFGILFLPKKYPHSTGESENFKTGQKLYAQCLETGFGSREKFERILLIGYDQYTVDGNPFTTVERKYLQQSL